jgi:hypothetical protein
VYTPTNSARLKDCALYPFWAVDQADWLRYVHSPRGSERCILSTYPLRWVYVAAFPSHKIIPIDIWISTHGVGGICCSTKELPKVP